MSDRSSAQAPATRWLQLAIGVVCMVMIANLQYGQSGERRPVKAEATGSKPVCGAKPWW